MTERAAWMTQDPATMPAPRFSWYQPRYLSQASASAGPSDQGAGMPTRLTEEESQRAFFPSILASLLREGDSEGEGRPVGSSPSSHSSNPFVLRAELEGSLKEESERRAAVGLDWRTYSSMESLWNGPPLSAKVPPASDYTRLLSVLNA